MVKIDQLCDGATLLLGIDSKDRHRGTCSSVSTAWLFTIDELRDQPMWQRTGDRALGCTVDFSALYKNKVILFAGK